MSDVDRRTVLKLLGAGASAFCGGRAIVQAANTLPSSQRDPSGAKTLCEQLADYVVGLRFESLPSEVVNKAQDVILHNLAVAFGGVGTDQYNKAVDFVERRPGPATIIGQHFKTSVADAAF